jgi:hypothetical protein
MLVSVEDFQSLTKRIRQLRSELREARTQSAGQKARKFIDNLKGNLYYDDWEFQFKEHGTVSPALPQGALKSGYIRDALWELAVVVVRLAKQPSRAYRDLALKSADQFLQLQGHSVGRAKPTGLDQVLVFAEGTLKGIERRVIELVCEGGGACKLSDIALDPAICWNAPWDDTFNSARKRINTKIKSAALPWRLRRQSNEARLVPLANGTKKS